MVVLKLILYILFAVVMGLLYLGYARKFTARIHRRYGPPIYQQFLDVLKLFSKKNLISHGVIFDLGVVMGLGGIILTLLFVPAANFYNLSNYGDFLVIIYLIMIPSLGMALGAGEAANPNAIIGISRALIVMLGYEIPFTFVIMALMLIIGDTSLAGIIQYQQQENIWFLWKMPLAAIAMLAVLQGQLGEKPFEVMVAPHEIATGPMVEYGGKYLGMLFLFKAVALFVELTIFIDLFMGGANTILELVIKQLVLFSIILIINAVYPRYRTEQVVKFYIAIPNSLALIAVIKALLMTR